MTSSQRPSRRLSARLMEREDALPNGHGMPGTGGGGTAGRPQTNGKAGGGGGAASKKRKPNYDEEDDGFMFTRTRSKRAKAAPAVSQPEPIAEEREESVPAPAKTRRKRSSDTPSVPEKEDHGLKVKKKRSTRNSGEKRATEEKKVNGRRVEDKDDGEDPHARSTMEPMRVGQRGGEAEDSIDLEGGVLHVERPRDATKIALPFADTPVIRRNKEMRKGTDTGHRRSSLGMRGRRASSLIDGGKSNALPHDEVEVTEFYKHIESDGLSEPRRMKQLLTWCGTRAMGEKPSYSSEDSNARLAARVIQEELLKDFSTRSEMSDWFNREETAPAVHVKKPNPKNISNAAKIQDLEAQIKRLQEERATWEELLKPLNAPEIPPQSTSTVPKPSDIDPSLLDPEQAEILKTLTSHQNPGIVSSTSSRLLNISANLESTVDEFADGIHKLGQYREAADRVAGRVLGLAAGALEERDREGRRRARTEDVDVKEVLRGLSRIDR
ncbi:MAG: hypothetical protein M1830_004138 [Pleopsidium flavum]|nr:MAG: hypothetical protein M1830_004138 [Pleopsidium flavum]